MTQCYLSPTPNGWGCYDPQCNDSTWDHECPVGPCTVHRLAWWEEPRIPTIAEVRNVWPVHPHATPEPTP